MPSDLAVAIGRLERQPTDPQAGPPTLPADAWRHNTSVDYGSWPSPLSAARVTAGALRLAPIQLHRDDVYWIEGRASEGGRNVIVKRSASGQITDVTPPEFNARTRVHEYGGAAYTVPRGTVFFS